MIPRDGRWRRGALLALAVLSSGLAVAEPRPVGPPVLVDATAAAGLRAVHDRGVSGRLHFPEIMGSGGALLDYDGDGDLDLYVVQGARQGAPAAGGADATDDEPADAPCSHTDRLFRNDTVILPDGSRRVRFVAAPGGDRGNAGIVACGQGMGAATGDYDGDGHTDLYVTNAGPNQLWRNRGDGTFEETTAAAGVEDERWSVGASFADLDGDGHLDLFVANYVAFRPAVHKECRSPAGRPDYCGPRSYPAEPDRLFRNRGDGTFEDVSVPSGIYGRRGNGLGVVAADLDGDGRTDLYVANDQMPNFLWRNLGGLRFREEAVPAGVAVNLQGLPEAGMGVDAGDLDGDGDEDLFLTHLTGETHTLYLNDGEGQFTDRTAIAGLGGPTLAATGFGTLAADLDLDGDLDLPVVAGAVRLQEDPARAGDPFPFHQPDQLFLNRGDGRFEEVGHRLAAFAGRREVGRGLAVGDLDDDGDPDLVVFNNSGPVRVLLARAPSEHRWIGMRLLTAGGRDALGARVEATLGDGRRLVRRARTDGGYASAHDPRVVLGLGRSATLREVVVAWPDGQRQALPVAGLEWGRYHVVRQGAESGQGKGSGNKARPGQDRPAAGGER